MTPALWQTLHGSVLVCWLLLAMWQDLRERRVANAWVFSGAGLGLLLSFTPGPVDWACSLAGGVLGMLSQLWLYALRAMGAGDVKLMGMVGLFLGASALPDLVVRVWLAGGVLSLLWLWRSRWPHRVQNPAQLLDAAGQQHATRVPYALAIGLGTVSHLAAAWPQAPL
jgi:prepilin peptidase CpaA